MKAQKNITLKTVSGKEIEAIVTYTRRIENETVNADGMIVETGKEEIFENVEIEFILNGKTVETVKLAPQACDVQIRKTSAKGYTGIACGHVLLAEESGEMLKAEIAEMVSKSADEETKEIKAKKAEEIKNDEIKEAEAIVEQAEKQDEIPTKKEAEKIKKEFNDTYNEGGYGYVPEIIDLETYEIARKVLGKNNDL